MQVPIRTPLLAAIELCVVWYFIGGRSEIAWYESVRSARAQGWDLSPADRWPHYGILYYLPAYGVGILMSVSGIRGIGVLLKKISKAKAR